MRKLLLVSVFCLAGCAHPQAHPDSPALIADPSPQTRAELRTAVAAVLGVGDVTIADDALTQSSTLFVERSLKRDAKGQLLSGRELGRPERFDLVASGEKCVLIRAKDGQRFQLKHTACKAI